PRYRLYWYRQQRGATDERKRAERPGTAGHGDRGPVQDQPRQARMACAIAIVGGTEVCGQPGKRPMLLPGPSGNRVPLQAPLRDGVQGLFLFQWTTVFFRLAGSA